FAMLSQPLSHVNGSQQLIPSLELFRHSQEHRQQFQAILRGQAAERLRALAQTTLSQTIEESLTTTYPEQQRNAVPFTVVAQYLTGAFLTLLNWWVEADMPYSPEQMNDIFQQLALPGVWATVNGEPNTE